MTIEGVVKDGVIVPTEPVVLVEGMKVQIALPEIEPADKSLSETLLGFAGLAHGLPSDFAEQHDHYIHGAP